jgi:hypothetical protein
VGKIENVRFDPVQGQARRISFVASLLWMTANGGWLVELGGQEKRVAWWRAFF